MPEIFKDVTQKELVDVPYEIKKWLLEYQIISHHIILLKEDIDFYRSSIMDAIMRNCEII